jgi:hypothetical protein
MSENQDGTENHPYYGPCDEFGPNGECAECTGVVQCTDGSKVSARDGSLIKGPPLKTRIRGALLALRSGAIHATREVSGKK